MYSILDLTDESDHRRRIRDRPASNVDALVLHQMGFDRGNDPRSYLRVKAHFIILQDGTVAQLHNITDYLYSSNGLNSRSVAVEFAGNFPSSRGGWWHPRGTTAEQRQNRQDRVNHHQVSAGLFLIGWLMFDPGIRFLFAHRQAGTHHNCPGPGIWFNIGEEGLKMGLSDGGPNFKMGHGKTIPDSWRNYNYWVFEEEEIIVGG
jgi:hypothetical protein